MEEHIGQCQRCTAVLTGTRNLVELYGDERLFQTPVGFSWRLQRKIARESSNRRRLVFGWAVAFAALALVCGTFELAQLKSASSGNVRSGLSQPGYKGPAELAVVLNVRGKLFHIKGCPFLKEDDGVRNTTAAEAVKEGYLPCIRCLGEYVTTAAGNLIKKAWLAV